MADARKKGTRDPALDHLLFPELSKEWTLRDLRKLADVFRKSAALSGVVLQLAEKDPMDFSPVTVLFSREEAEAVLQVFDLVTWARRRIEKSEARSRWNWLRSASRKQP